MGHKPFIVACIPAHNEERTIAKVIVKTMKHVDKVIVCDDGAKAEKDLKPFENAFS